MSNYVKLEAHTSSNGMQHILVFLDLETTTELDFIIFNVENAEASIVEIQDSLDFLAKLMDIYPRHVLQIVDLDNAVIVKAQ